MDKKKVFAEVLQRHREDKFPHLADMTITTLCERRLRIAEKVKQFEEEKEAIDEILFESLSEAELRIGIRVTNGYIKLKQKGYWEYKDETKDAISAIRSEAQQVGDATKLMTSYLSFVKA